MENKETFLTKRELAKLMKVSTRTLEHWMSKGILPYMKVGGVVRFQRDEVMANLDSFVVNKPAA